MCLQRGGGCGFDVTQKHISHLSFSSHSLKRLIAVLTARGAEFDTDMPPAPVSRIHVCTSIDTHEEAGMSSYSRQQLNTATHNVHTKGHDLLYAQTVPGEQRTADPQFYRANLLPCLQ